MRAKKPVVGDFDHLYSKEPSYTMDDGYVVERGALIKVAGVHGTNFSFWDHTTRTDSGAQWFDCFLLEKGQKVGQYSFTLDRLKPIKPVTRRPRRKKGVPITQEV
jgi:hypothetical protein